jgi:dolichol-phosphate mannosyltransferase
MRPGWLLALLALLQAVAGARVVWRLARTARGVRIRPSDAPQGTERVSVIVPVLNEQGRLAPCLEGVISQPGEVAEIFVVDGGSSDGTCDLVARFAARDGRVRPITTSPIPAGWNGKAYGLQTGLQRADPASHWIMTVDADVRPDPALTRSLLSHARRTGDAAIGVATTQRLSGAAEGVLHPAMLTTLVYRFGIPGHATTRVGRVQANGQCSLYRRSALEACGGFGVARSSRCEDVTIARALSRAGFPVGFYEGEGLVSAEMYAGWRDAWQNWPRSLPMRDRYMGIAGWIGLAEVVLAQGLPLALFLLLTTGGARSARNEPHDVALTAPVSHGDGRGRHGREDQVTSLALTVNAALLMVRLGVLVGTARAYPRRPWTYWLSPLADLPVAAQLWRSALRHRHVWRGREMVDDDPWSWR